MKKRHPFRTHGRPGTVFLFSVLICIPFLLFSCSGEGKGGKETGSGPSSAAQEEGEGFQRLRTSLRPLLEQEKNIRPDWVYRPLAPGLLETFVVDRQGSFDRVTKTLLKKWGITKEKLVEESEAWFTVFVDPLKFRVFQKDEDSGSPKVAHPDLHGIYTASLILHPSFKEGLKKVFGRWEGLLVAIPSQKHCWVLRASDEGIRKKLRKELVQEFKTSPHPLLDHYLSTKAGGGYEPGPPF